MNTVHSKLNKFYHRWLLRPLGLDYQTSSIFWILLFLGALMFGGYWFLQNTFAVIGLVLVSAIVFISFIRPDFSLYGLLACVLAFDQYGIPNFPSFTTDIYYFKNLKEIPYIPMGGAGVFNLIELHFVLLFLALFLWIAVKRDFELQPIPAWPLFLLFFGGLLIGFMNGIGTGGDFLTAIWEIRALFYLCLLYVLVPQIIQTRQQIRVLMWIFIIFISFKAFQGVFRFIGMGFTTGGYATLMNHEDPVFINTLVILLIGFLTFKVRDTQLGTLLLLLLPLALGFYVAQRRAAYAGAMVSGVAFFLLLPSNTRIKVLKASVPIFILLVIYTAAFWNSESSLGRPIDMIKSGFIEPSIEENYQDYSSNRYRERENYNLARTVANNPVIGVGFGNKYEQPLDLVQLNFSLQEYIPHNEIYWLFTKTGIVGFLSFWMFFNGFVAKGVKVFLRQRDPYLKAVTMMIVIAVINQMVVSFFDLQLTYYRNMIYLGTLMGLMSTLERLAPREEPEEENHRAMPQERETQPEPAGVAYS